MKLFFEINFSKILRKSPNLDAEYYGNIITVLSRFLSSLCGNQTVNKSNSVWLIAEMRAMKI